MSQSLWWKDEYWWEKKVIPLGAFTLSVRQAVSLALVCSVGALVSLPANFGILGLPFGGKVVVFGAVVLVGFVYLVRRRVKLVPIEMQVLYYLTNRNKTPQKALLTEPLPTAEPQEKSAQEMVVEDFAAPVPFSFAGRAKVSKTTRVLLTVDGDLRAESVVSPATPDYRLIYVPKPTDIGLRDVLIQLEGAPVPLNRARVLIKARGVDVLEGKEHAK